MFRRHIAACAMVCIAGAAEAELTPDAGPEHVLASIRANGARKVMLELWDNEVVFDALLSHVDRGDTKWFPVWLQLREPADGGISESIDIAFARAIPRAPQAVLRLVGHGLEIDRICTSPFIEPDPGVAEDYERKALRALSRVKDPKLKSLARSCATGVRLPKERR